MRSSISRLRTSHAASGNPLNRRVRRISASEKREEARAFLQTYFAEIGSTPAAFQKRWAEVRTNLSRHGHYEHTPEELAFGARIAWRNHGKCIGRLFWESLEVFDCRKLIDPSAIAERVDDHLRNAVSDGRIKSIISVFAPIIDGETPAWIESEQITQYACHQMTDGRWLGDRQNVEMTQIAKSMGWQPDGEPGQFDLLPWFLRDRHGRRIMHKLKPGSVREIKITHPFRDGLSELGLRWYAVPVVSGMILTIGGIDYPCAPFNGFYMSTEIASRNFCDVKRYDILGAAAKKLEVDTSKSNPLWIDETLTELNRAVIHSYAEAGVLLIDHHAAAKRYMEFHAREQRSGRRVAGDWRWLVPPQAASSVDLFHLRMRNFHPVPNYYRNRGDDGLRLMPWYGDRYRRRWQFWADRIKRRWKLWKRMAW